MADVGMVAQPPLETAVVPSRWVPRGGVLGALIPADAKKWFTRAARQARAEFYRTAKRKEGKLLICMTVCFF